MDKHFLAALVRYVLSDGASALRYSDDTTLVGMGDGLKEKGPNGTLPASDCQRNVVAAAMRAVKMCLPERETLAWTAMEWARGYLTPGAELTVANLRAAMPAGNFQDIQEHLWVLPVIDEHADGVDICEGVSQ